MGQALMENEESSNVHQFPEGLVRRGDTAHDLQDSPSDDTLDGMDNDLVDAKLAAVEARTDTKFAELIGKMDLYRQELGSKIDGVGTSLGARIDTLDARVSEDRADRKSNFLWTIGTIITVGLALAGVIVSSFSIFQGGMGITASAYQSGMTAAEARHK